MTLPSDAYQTKVLQIRITPGGRTYLVHPEDHDLERYLSACGGRAVIKASFLLSREKETKKGTESHCIRTFLPIND